LLFAGGHFLVNASVSLARALKFSPLVIGLTIVAFGSSAPELLVSIDAALTDHADIVLGNIVGSNIANILLVLGLSAAIFPIALSRKTMRRDGGAMVAATLLFYLLALSGLLGILEGLVLLTGLMLFLWAAFNVSKACHSSTDVTDSFRARISSVCLRSGVTEPIIGNFRGDHRFDCCCCGNRST